MARTPCTQTFCLKNCNSSITTLDQFLQIFILILTLAAEVLDCVLGTLRFLQMRRGNKKAVDGSGLDSPSHVALGIFRSGVLIDVGKCLLSKFLKEGEVCQSLATLRFAACTLWLTDVIRVSHLGAITAILKSRGKRSRGPSWAHPNVAGSANSSPIFPWVHSLPGQKTQLPISQV